MFVFSANSAAFLCVLCVLGFSTPLRLRPKDLDRRDRRERPRSSLRKQMIHILSLRANNQLFESGFLRVFLNGRSHVERYCQGPASFFQRNLGL